MELEHGEPQPEYAPLPPAEERNCVRTLLRCGSTSAIPPSPNFEGFVLLKMIYGTNLAFSGVIFASILAFEALTLPTCNREWIHLSCEVGSVRVSACSVPC
jgi:hypothetical protein